MLLNHDLKCSMSENYCLFLEGVHEFLPKPLASKLENWAMAWGTSSPDVFFLCMEWKTMKLGSVKNFWNWATGFPHVVLFRNK